MHATHTVMGYQATRTGKELTVHRVPIFVACQRDDVSYDDSWIKEAVMKAKQAEREGYLPPLHIRHHGKVAEANNTVRRAGFFRILGTEPITFKGRRRTAVLADLIITDPAAQHEVEDKLLPYRSVEIFKVEEPNFDSLALLDHEAPFLELPMLMVSEIDDKSSDGEVLQGTFGKPWHMDVGSDDEPLAAYFRRGDRAHLLFRREELDMPTTTKTPEQIAAEAAEAEKKALFAADDDKPKDGDDKGEDMEGEGGGLDVSSVCKAIESGEISINDMDAILAAIQGQKTEADTEGETAPVPAAAPGAQAMKKGPMDAQFATMQGKIDALQAKDNARDESETRKDQVAEAMKRLEGRPLGADLETKLFAFHKDYGPEAFKAYVESMAQTFGVLPSDGSDGSTFHGQAGKVPEVAMKYSDQGTDAVDKAAHFAREWQELQGHGIKCSQESYVQRSMNRILNRKSA